MDITVDLPDGQGRPYRKAEVLEYQNGWVKVRYCNNKKEETVTAKAIMRIHTNCKIENIFIDTIERDYHVNYYCTWNCQHKCLKALEVGK